MKAKKITLKIAKKCVYYFLTRIDIWFSYISNFQLKNIKINVIYFFFSFLFWIIIDSCAVLRTCGDGLYPWPSSLQWHHFTNCHEISPSAGNWQRYNPWTLSGFPVFTCTCACAYLCVYLISCSVTFHHMQICVNTNTTQSRHRTLLHEDPSSHPFMATAPTLFFKKKRNTKKMSQFRFNSLNDYW